ncbi:hypothetical protein [Serratia sp. DD3]|uniref:hypothetical protein n=1 Tax=Serratia sp. DD3 TaxID=1410619 RepID=UPI0012694D8D|nr:hypothetical protein [Serratia sp. DD3]
MSKGSQHRYSFIGYGYTVGEFSGGPALDNPAIFPSDRPEQLSIGTPDKPPLALHSQNVDFPASGSIVKIFLKFFLVLQP